MKRVSVTKSFTFSAVHHLPYHDGEANRVHGHTYKLQVTVSDHVDQVTGLIFDFKEFGNVVNREIVSVYDYRNLNDFFENPTTENLVCTIFDKLDKVFSIRGYRLVSVKLWDSENSYAECEVV